MGLYVIRDKKTKKFYGLMPIELNDSSHRGHWYPQKVNAKAFCFDHDISQNDVDILTKHGLEVEIKKRHKVRR